MDSATALIQSLSTEGGLKKKRKCEFALAVLYDCILENFFFKSWEVIFSREFKQTRINQICY